MCVEAHAERVASSDPLLCSQTRVYVPPWKAVCC